jgi:hypothetical protein
VRACLVSWRGCVLASLVTCLCVCEGWLRGCAGHRCAGLLPGDEVPGMAVGRLVGWGWIDSG